jgi:uncharacterized protein (TIGR03083 family)
VTAADRHLRACVGLTRVVDAVGDGWARPSPCTEWDARAVLEHVIGFHDVLVLRPASAKPSRPRHDPVDRWAVTAAALAPVLRREPPEMLPLLTMDVLVHTWDLARAAGVALETHDDLDLWRSSYERALAHRGSLAASGMYGPPVAVPGPGGETDPVTGLVALTGRDPAWTAP